MPPAQVGDTLRWEAPQSDINFILIPLIVGFFFQAFFVGICLATFTHYVQSPEWTRDSVPIRVYLTCVVVLTLVSAALAAVTQAKSAAYQGRNSQWLAESAPLEPKLAFILWYIVTLAVQLFLARRVCLVMRQISRLRAVLLLVCLALTISASFVCAIWATVRGGYMTYIDNANLSWADANLFYVALAAAAVTDLAVTTTLGWLWLQLKGLNRRTDTLLRKLVAFTLSTALYTTLPAIVCAILRFTETYPLRKPILSNAFLYALMPLYPLALFTTLNHRPALRHATHDPVPSLREVSAPAVLHSISLPPPAVTVPRSEKLHV